MGLVDRMRERLARPVDRAAGVGGPNPPPTSGPPDGFVHAPNADVEDVPLPRRVGFDGRELPQNGSQSGSFPAGGIGAGGSS